MSSPSYFRSDTAITLAPWIVATAACVLAFVLLAHFIDTLHFQMQRGQALQARLSASTVTSLEIDRRVAGADPNLARTLP